MVLKVFEPLKFYCICVHALPSRYVSLPYGGVLLSSVSEKLYGSGEHVNTWLPNKLLRGLSENSAFTLLRKGRKTSVFEEKLLYL